MHESSSRPSSPELVKPHRAIVVVVAVVGATALYQLAKLGKEGATWVGISWIATIERLAVPLNWASLALFLVGLGELYARYRQVRTERGVFGARLLPEDFETVIERSYIPKIFQKLEALPRELRLTRLSNLVEVCASKYQTSRDVSEVAEALRMQMDVELSRADTGYSLVRYVAWGIPVLGFVGTVLGLSKALGHFGKVNEGYLEQITNDLHLAFDTTFVALILAFILMYFYHRVSEAEEKLLHDTSEYCLRNFINRAFYPIER